MSGYGRVQLQHGHVHEPFGTDPTRCSVWHYVGETHEPPFVNGTNASPTTYAPNPVPLRFRLSVGPPNVCVYDLPWPAVGDASFPNPTSIDQYTQHQVEIQGDVTGLVPGDTVFVIPMEYRHEYDVAFHTHDGGGFYVPCRLLSTGEFVWASA